jgi:hypothetical protein
VTGWSAGVTLVTLRASDNTGGSGVEFIRFSATGANPIDETTVTGKVAEVTISAAGSTELTFSARDLAGNESASQTITINVDLTLPVSDAPVATLDGTEKLAATTARVTISWSGTDPDSGLKRFQLEQMVDGGAWSSLSFADPLTTSTTRSLNLGSTYQFRVRAIDEAGNTGEWSTAAAFTLIADQESVPTLTYSGEWQTQSLAGTSGGATQWSATAGSSVTYSFTGGQVAWISRLDANRGMAEVWIDGEYVTTVDLYSATVQGQQPVFVSGWYDAGTSHTLEIRVLGTANAGSAGTRVDVDAIVAIAPVP